MKTMEQQRQVFEALSEPTRLRMVNLLLASKTYACQCELVDALETPATNISRHAKELLQAGVFQDHKEGKWVHYRLADGLNEILSAIEKTEDPIFEKDAERFRKRLAIRENGKCLLGVQNKALA